MSGSRELYVVYANQMILAATPQLEWISRSELQSPNGEMMSLAKNMQIIS